MRSVNIAELKNRLSAYIRFARAGEEIVIRDRNLPVARRPWTPEVVEEFLKMPKPTPRGKTVTEALLEEREEGW